jgi:hypothetical protein
LEISRLIIELTFFLQAAALYKVILICVEQLDGEFKSVTSIGFLIFEFLEPNTELLLLINDEIELVP